MSEVGKDTVIQVLSGIVAIKVFFNLNMSFLSKQYISEYRAKRGQNVPLSYNCANSIGASK
jgi:hypothetical protein